MYGYIGFITLNLLVLCIQFDNVWIYWIYYIEFISSMLIGKSLLDYI